MKQNTKIELEKKIIKLEAMLEAKTELVDTLKTLLAESRAQTPYYTISTAPYEIDSGWKTNTYTATNATTALNTRLPNKYWKEINDNIQ